jgi:hypothetical protein
MEWNKLTKKSCHALGMNDVGGYKYGTLSGQPETTELSKHGRLIRRRERAMILM